MAPERQYPTPAEQLVTLLSAARRRGQPFEDAWRVALQVGESKMVVTTDAERPVGAIVWPRDHGDRTAWMSAVNGTRAGWERAYVGVEMSAGERAIGVLFGALSEVGERELPQEIAA